MDQRFVEDGKHKDPDTAMALGFFLGPLGLLYIGKRQAALGFAILLPAIFAFEILRAQWLDTRLSGTGMTTLRLALWVAYAVGLGLYARSEAKRLNDIEFEATHPDFHLHQQHLHLHHPHHQPVKH